MTPPLVHVSLLGPLEVTVAGEAMPAGGPGRRALLAALALEVGAVVAVHDLMEAIWDDRAPMTALTKLHGHVCALRQDLTRLGGPEGAQVLQTRPPGYVLCRHRTSTDLRHFEELRRAAAAARLPQEAGHRARCLSSALGLWRGAACADVSSSRLAAAAAILDERRWRAAEDLAEARLALRDHGGAIDSLEWLVQQAPYRERAWELLLRAHLGRGDVSSARSAHDALCRIFRAGLGVAPGRRIGELMAGVGDDRRSGR